MAAFRMRAPPPKRAAETMITIAPRSHGRAGWMLRRPTVGMYQKKKPMAPIVKASTRSRVMKTPFPGLYATLSGLPCHSPPELSKALSNFKPVALYEIDCAHALLVLGLKLRYLEYAAAALDEDAFPGEAGHRAGSRA